jgi:hypothetical protein
MLNSKRQDRPLGPHCLPFNGNRCPFPEVKRPGRKADHSTLSSDEPKNEWSLIPSPPLYLYGAEKTLLRFTNVKVVKEFSV